jgi:hypothetical protein
MHACVLCLRRNAPSYDFADAEALCVSYGGTLASLSSPDALSSEGLTRSVTYWVGLVNSIGVGGQNGTWTWVDQTPYQVDSTPWATNQPAVGKTCGYLRYSANKWRVYADLCTAHHALVCELPSNGAGPGLACATHTAAGLHTCARCCCRHCVRPAVQLSHPV